MGPGNVRIGKPDVKQISAHATGTGEGLRESVETIALWVSADRCQYRDAGKTVTRFSPGRNTVTIAQQCPMLTIRKIVKTDRKHGSSWGVRSSAMIGRFFYSPQCHISIQ